VLFSLWVHFLSDAAEKRLLSVKQKPVVFHGSQFNNYFFLPEI
jgi:hypothetical protein